MNMKKTISGLLVVLIVAAVITGCGAKAKDTITGAAGDVLSSVITDADASLPEAGKLPVTFNDPVTAETSPGALGLTADDFTKYISEAYTATAMLNVNAHGVALVNVKDIKDAATVKKLMADGFDSQKWVCVMPEISFVIDSGSYILLAATTKSGADALVSSFSALAGGNVGDRVNFYEFS
jgi:hypothetical protein